MMNEIFKYMVDGAINPVVICDLNKKILYMNRVAVKYYSNGREMIGKPIELFMSEETQSKVNMCIEWFKEDVNNNSVFALHDKKDNTDIYMHAIRDPEGNLVAVCSHADSRTPDQNKTFDID